MDSKHRYKAEDFLSDRIPEDQQHLISEGEQDLANEIKATVKAIGQEKIPALEAAELWERIQSETAAKPKMQLWKTIVKRAAIVLLIAGIGLWQYDKNTPTSRLLDFAAQNVGSKNINATDQDRAKQLQKPFNNEGENIITANDFNTLVVGNGQRSLITLPDGTKVWLNSQSRLIYPLSFEKNSREVYLEGEAYFDVAHNKAWPFYVRSKKMEIKVLGTEFFVSANNERSNNYAVLVNGSIAFSTGSWLNKKERELVPGQQISLDTHQDEISVSNVNTSEFRSWKDGYIHVESEPLDTIVQKIAKYYHIEISTAGLDLRQEKFSGRLDFQRSATDVLDILCYGTPYRYNSEERRLEKKSY